MSDNWKNKGGVADIKVNPDLVWLRGDSGGDRRKVVVDVKVASTEDSNKVFKRKILRVGDAGDAGEQSGDGDDGSPHCLPRWPHPQRQGWKRKKKWPSRLIGR